jgi:hypothetical protein
MTITDRKHLANVTQKVLAATMDLQEMWLQEDRDACSPRRTESVPTSGGDTSDPTFRVVDDKYRHVSRDQIGRTMMHVLSSLQDELARQRPKPEGRERCRNCRWAAATHGQRCEACDRWRRRYKGEERPRQVFEAHRDRVVEAEAARQSA